MPSPAWHKSLSGALNQFALKLVPAVVERAHKGKVLYAGGDDVMAMVSVDDLLSTLTWLRMVYSGLLLDDLTKDDAVRPAWCGPLQNAHKEFARWSHRKNWINNGFVRYGRELLPTLGYRFTASAGAVIAHKKDPLNRVLKQLRLAEKQAKQSGRNAFCIKTLKRSGGAETLTAHWFADPPLAPSPEFSGTPMACLLELSGAIGRGELSRRAIYHSADWLRQLPGEQVFADSSSYRDMLAVSLAQQFRSQSQGGQAVTRQLSAMAKSIVGAAFNERQAFRRYGTTGSARDTSVRAILNGILATAEFLARDGRATGFVKTTNEEAA